MDLDDTIFQTKRKCGPGALHQATLGLNGQPSSFFNPQQYNLLKLLQGRSLVVPTTARNRESFCRVQLNFDQGAILDHGGLIFQPNGELDLDWHGRMYDLCYQASPMLLEIKRKTEEFINREKLTCQVRIVADHGLNFYVLIKNYNSQTSELAVIKDNIAELYSPIYETWIHFNDNNLAIIPKFLGKAEAVSYFLKTYISKLYPELPVIGMGDSLSDLDFLGLGDFMLVPARSQLARNFSHREMDKQYDY